MYPTLSDLSKDIFGFGIPLPIKMFGLFVAVAFLIAMFLLKKELERREKAGWLKPYQEIAWIGKPISSGEIIITGLVSMLFWLAFIFFIKGGFSFENNREIDQPYYGLTVIDLVFALIVGVLIAFLRYHFKSLKASQKPELKMVSRWPHERTDTLIGIAAVGGIIGAKLFDGLENWNSYMAHPSDFWAFSGLTFYGGLIVATFATLYYAHQKDLNKWQLVDSAAPVLMLAYGIGRIGCHMAGDGDWGIVNPFPKPMNWLPDWLWSYTYPHNVSDQGAPIPGCAGLHCFQLPRGVFPTSLYEFIVCSLLFLVLWKLRKKITSPGQLFGIYLIMNGTERFLIELIRVNNKYDLGFVRPTQAELISVGLIFTGCALTFFPKKTPLPKHKME